MQYSIDKNYLVFPVSRNAKLKNISFYKDSGECVQSLDLRLDYETAEYEAYIDVKRFRGDCLDVAVSPNMKLLMRAKDRMPVCRFRETLRPKYHFTAPEGSCEAPGSLVYSGGMYHLFYRTNPVGTEAGNAHAGHAVSKNLADWDYMSMALFPDVNGTVLVGSAVLDEKNLLGTKNCEKTPVVFYYTAKGEGSNVCFGKPFGQRMAFSCDGCDTFTKMPGGEVVPQPTPESACPAVVYSTRYDMYVMTLYAGGERYAVFTSKDLKGWNKTEEISLPGECESAAFLPFVVSEKEEKWVLIGAHDKYIVGDFDGEHFTSEHKGVLAFNYSQPYSFSAAYCEGEPSGRTLRVLNMKTELDNCGMKFGGCLAFAQELQLVRTKDGDRIHVKPASELEKLHGKKVKDSARGKESRFELRGVAQDIKLALEPLSAEKAALSLFGKSFELDFKNMTFACDKCTAPMLADENGRINVRIITDTCGYEIYLGDGFAYMTLGEIPDSNLNILEICSESEIGVKLEAYRLRDSRRSDKRR